MCHGFIQNRHAFEVPARSLLVFLRAAGFVVATVELRGRDATSPIAQGLHAYSDVDAPALIDALAARGHRAIAWVGHSMGGLVATLLPPRARDRLRAVVTIGAPLFPGRPSLHLFEGRSTSLIVRAARATHARGVPFRGRAWSGGLHAARAVLDVPWVPLPVRLWAPGSLAADALAHTLAHSFADDSFAAFADLLELAITQGARAGSVDAEARLAAFALPVLVVAGDCDDLAPRAGARPLFERLGSAHKEYLEVGALCGARTGHIDLLVGDQAPALVWPAIGAFLRRHLTP